MRKGFLSIWASFGVITLSVVTAQVTVARVIASPPFKPGEVIVKLKQNPGFSAQSTGAQAHSLLMAMASRYAMTVTPFRTDPTLVKITVNGKVSMGQLIADLRANPGVEYAEPNYILYAYDPPQGSSGRSPSPIRAVIPNDPNFGLNWGLLNIGQKDNKGQLGKLGSDIGTTMAWTQTTGTKEIVVAVIDTGIDYNHPDLKNNIYTNPNEIPGNGIDDDGNGFIDDVHGWNFEKNNNDPMDDNRHGTHCAGTIGADGNNGIGTAGVNWKVSLMPLKFLSASGSGSLSDAVEAVKYATKMNVNVMSNSWGGGGFSQAMYDSIKAARQKGILVVAAAGNDGNDNDKYPAYPASYELDNVISVAATDNRDQKSSWSNFGQRKVHLSAPGVGIYSTIPGGGYGTFSGTSMACPHVAGAAALLWSKERKMNYAQIKERLLSTVDPVRTLYRKTVAGGRLNVYNAIMNQIPQREAPPSRWKDMAKVIESKHPYENNTNQTFQIQHPGAKHMRVHFTKIATEPNYDVIKVKSASGELFDELSGNLDDYTTDYVDGDKIVLEFTTDGSITGFGFVMDRYEFAE